MKESGILKAVSYILLPIIILILVLSSFYAIMFSEYNYETKKDYFESTDFALKVESAIETIAHDLIYAKESDYRNVIYDGENRIFIVSKNAVWLDDLKSNSFLAIYENKVYTNLNLDECNIELLRQEMLKKMQNQKYVSFVNGDMSSNSEYMTKFFKGNENFFKGSSFDYYTIEGDEIIPSDFPSESYTIVTKIYDAPELEEESQLEGLEEGYERVERVYKSATIDEFEIYLSYEEDFAENSSKNIILDNLSLVRPYKTVIYIAFPLSIIGLMIIIVYLVNSIGHSKGKEDIDINAFDKVPFEIILAVFGTCLGICLVILFDSAEPFYDINIATFLILAGSFYTINIAFLEMIAITFIKRIKAKMFLQTCLLGKILIYLSKILKRILGVIKNILKKIQSKIGNFINRIKYNPNFTLKFGGIVIACMIIMFIAGVYFGPIGVIINVIIAELFIAWFFVRIQSFKRFEDVLKQVSEGTLKDRIEVSDYCLEFKNSVEYLNNISNGFETAIEESMKSERMKTELITNVSHDIKTPLTSIINYVDLLKKENIENEKAKEYLDILDSKSQRLKRLTEDLVEASKASSGNLKLDLKQINIVELINQASGEFEDKFKDKKLDIITNFEKPTINIKADSRYMYRVIENLFSNVSKYALDGSRVYIDVKKENNEAKIEIKNISKERLNITEEELMQRFVRGDKSRTTEGSGLGLAIARSLVVLQGGKFECKIDGDLFKIEITMKWI